MADTRSISLLVAAATTWATAMPPARAAVDRTAGTQPAAPQVQTASLPATAPAADGEARWLPSLPEGIQAAQRAGKPILVEIGAEWCGWCKQLEGEMQKTAAQKALAHWTLVRLDLDKDPEAARSLAVSGVPALRVLSSQGRTLASKDGFLPAADLAAWLAEHLEQAKTADAPLVVPTDVASANALLDRVSEDNPVLREIVFRRLLACPHWAAPGAVEAFAAGDLAKRLALLELLEGWAAPIDQIDPWEPQTLSVDRLEALKQWAKQRAAAPPPPTPAEVTPATQGSAETPTSQPSADAPPAALSPEALSAARVELEGLVRAEADVAAHAFRERLVRYGRALMPEVYAALKRATRDQERQRLTSLRYRLAASDELAVAWPGGFDRLANANVGVRHAALEELASRATPNDSPLLLELFADPDPLLRERSLQLLQAMGGQGAMTGLVRLLNDPEPNVRAAVLKHLAEKPVAGLDERLAEFVNSEQDSDLVVHAVRVFGQSKSNTAVGALLSLLTHESWRVRAEAAEAVGKITTAYDTKATVEQKADVNLAMKKLLEDPDSFVVSRALIVLGKSKRPDISAAVDQAVQRYPALALEAVKTLAANDDDPESLKVLRRYTTNSDAAVRAAALSAWCEAKPTECEAELKAGIADASPKVQAAAVAAAVDVLKKARPEQNQTISFPRTKPTPVDYEQWLADFRSGKGQPGWAADFRKALPPMLGSDQPADVAADAATLLAAFGQESQVMDLLRKRVNQDAEKNGPLAARVLPWLPWDARIAFYQELKAAVGEKGHDALASAMTELPNAKFAPYLWELAAVAPDGDFSDVNTYSQNLMKAYLGERYYDTESLSEDQKKSLVDAAMEAAASGSELRRLVGLVVLSKVDKGQLQAAAEKILSDATAGEALRGDAFQLALVSQDEAAATTQAVATLNATADVSWERRKTAARYLALGPAGLTRLRDRIYVSVSFSTSVSMSDNVPSFKPPPGLTTDMIRPMAEDTDGPAAASAAYLLALLGDTSKLDVLFNFWRTQEKRYSPWNKVVYQAVAASKDDARVPILEELFEAVKTEYSVPREMYRTVRPMEGPNALKLRKRMRDELGADVLR